MSLFKVKDWDVPSQPAVASSAQSSKKRKRPIRDAERVHTAEVNIEKLMHKVQKGGLEHGKDAKRNRKKSQRNGKEHTDGGALDAEGVKPPDKPPTNRERKRKSEGREGRDEGTPFRPSKRARKQGAKKVAKDVPAASSPIVRPLTETACGKSKKTEQGTAGLTSLQANMKDRLDGSRFRWINEVLYTTGSEESHKLMLDDPHLYEEYHTGFRQQVRSWPSNPISHYISVLSSYPRGTVIADLGCGDAMLARSLVPKGCCVLSYDLVEDGAFVLAANICQRIPLPGAENDLADHDQAQIVDVCVCALSLMSLDWVQCIRETWRILKNGGELKIAEVTSRFTDLDKFIAVITGLGFKFKSKDETNTHFTLFEFRKVARRPIRDELWEELRKRHTVLKPCEYKRR